MAERGLTRRTVLVLGGALCARQLGCGGPTTTDLASLPATVAAGAASNVALGTLRAVGGVPVGLGRDSGGIYALSLICTHTGCDITAGGSVSASGIHCPCHGSDFSANGQVLQGAAQQPLPHFAVTEDASGQLTVQTRQLVPPSQRLVV